MSLSYQRNKLSYEPELSKKYPLINCHEPELSKKYPVINSHMSLSCRKEISLKKHVI